MYYIVNYETNKISQYETEYEARVSCSIQLKFSKTLMVFLYTEEGFNKLNLNLLEYEFI